MCSIGIDLGTTNSCISSIRNGKPEVIENEQGKRTTPSYIYIGENETLCGKGAQKKCPIYPQNTIYDVKRFLGKTINDPSLKPFKRKWPFKLEEVEGKLKVFVDGRHFDPEEISGMLLKMLRERAEDRLLDKVKKAVITVPTYFNVIQRQATISAGKIAGFEEVKLLTEPTAAAIAYNVDRMYPETNIPSKEKTVFVFDFGGGTFDVSIVEMSRGIIKVLAIDGDVNLGGNDITLNLFNYVSSLIPNIKDKLKYMNHGQDKKSMSSYRYYRRLLGLCDIWKEDLSDSEEVVDEFEDTYLLISRAKFEEINEKLFATVIQIVKKCLNKIKLTPDKIDEILLIGGSSKIPIIREKLKKIFGPKLSQGINGDEAVSVGAAIVASKWDMCEEYSDFNFVDLCPYNLGIAVRETLTDGTFLENVMHVVIPKHTTLPAEHTGVYENAVDMASSITFEIFSGDDKYTLNNTLLGDLTVTGFTPGPAGSVHFDVTFIYDENGTLQVKAVERTTAKPHILNITLDIGNRSTANINKK